MGRGRGRGRAWGWGWGREWEQEQELEQDFNHFLPYLSLWKIPLYSLPAAWNDACDIRFQHNRLTFKIALKDKLLEDINND
jgi:hypothetical protein